MAKVNGRTLFFTTSPRSPEKMIPEIKLLTDNFSGQKWNESSQVSFMKKLSESDFFEGSGSKKYSSFSARDRINRAPKALGFVDLNPSIGLTEPGKNLISGKRQNEVFLRQFLKFQIPSPYHVPSDDVKKEFWVKPYLEIFRLIYEMEKVTFDEMMLFGMQLTDYHKFDLIKKKIQQFRIEKKSKHDNYKKWYTEKVYSELKKIYYQEILVGETKTRESADDSIDKFLKTQKSNIRDYTDALFRYLRITGLVNVSAIGHSISIKPEHKTEVEYFLKNISRDPEFIDSEYNYKKYLFNASLPELYTDNKDNLVQYIIDNSQEKVADIGKYSVEQLKDEKDKISAEKKETILNETKKELKTYKLFSDIDDMYDQIVADSVYDAPLMFEWNTWRAMTMIDGGNIIGNFNMDDDGLPISTAAGNQADIICKYDDFEVIVEVTLMSGQKQYEKEGESVARHLGKHKAKTGKETYCFFITPKLNDSVIAYFYSLYKVNISYYGGYTCIVPLSLESFKKLLTNSSKASPYPKPNDIKSIFLKAKELASSASSETDWYSGINKMIDKWMVA